MDKVQVVVTDANILINLLHIGRLSILGRLAQFEFVVPDEVVAEILNEDQAAALQAAIDAQKQPATARTQWSVRCTLLAPTV